jgi:hypothetical protein
MKQKVQIKFAEVKEIRYESPHFIVLYDQLRIQVDVERRDNLKGTSGGGENGQREV